MKLGVTVNQESAFVFLSLILFGVHPPAKFSVYSPFLESLEHLLSKMGMKWGHIRACGLNLL